MYWIAIDQLKVFNFYFEVEKINGSSWYLKMHSPACTVDVFTYQQDAGRIKEGHNSITSWSKALQEKGPNNSSKKFCKGFYR